MGKVIFSTKERIGIIREDGSLSFLESEYAKQYNRNKQSIREKQEWKTQGTGAKFMGVDPHLDHLDEKKTHIQFTGLCAAAEKQQLTYAIQVDEFFGVYTKGMDEEALGEDHILHTGQIQIYDTDYHAESGQIVLSMGQRQLGKHLALLDPKTSIYKQMTEGDAIDAHPMWSKAAPQTVVYDSCGIGFDQEGRPCGVSECQIYRLNLETMAIEELVHMSGFDCTKPHEDHEGNLYFIKKPKEENNREAGVGSALEAALMMPVHLVRSFGRIAGLTKKRTESNGGQQVQKKHNNECLVEGHLINVEENEKHSVSQGEQYPGIMPRNWQLVKKGKDGIIYVIKRGVLDFDLDEAGNIIYSNGKYVMRLLPDGKEEKLAEVPLATNLCCIE